LKILKENTAMVSVCMITYNHELYIRDALDGVVMQKTNFKIELIIGEDCSNDETRKICEDYAAKYPKLIQLLPSDRNLGMSQNGIRTLQSCKGKYIALLDGDDYWTDTLKLQKQVDFLEANEEYGICFHNTTQLNTFDNSKNSIIPNTVDDMDYSIEDYILNNKTATCSIVFKSECLGTIPKWFNNLPFGDLGIVLLVMNNSNKIGRVLSDVMGVYRIHEGGIHGSFHKSDNGLIIAYLQHIKFNKIISNQFLKEKKHKKAIFKKYSNTYNVLGRLYKRNNKLQFIKVMFLKSYYKLLIKFI
jgi:glycosyltransferase involved in cell wall biosynthesis